MAEDPHERSVDKPMYGERRPQGPAILGVVAIVVVIVLVIAVLTWVRYTT